MKLKLTYVRSAGKVSDVVVTTDATATVGEVARALLDADPVREEKARFADQVTLGVALPGDGRRVVLSAERAVGESVLISGSTVSVVAAPAQAVVGGVVAVLRVLEGPDASREFPLPAGASVVGRSPDADVVLSDQYVSGRHARVEVGGMVEVVDLNSANGVAVDGTLVPRVTLQPGQVVTLGDTILRVDLTSVAPPEMMSAEGSGAVLGAVLHNRSPRVELRHPEREYPRPAVPRESDDQPFPWLLLAAPIIMGLGLFAITRSPVSLMFVAMAPMMMLGNHLTTRGRSRRQLDKDVARFEEQLRELDAALSAEVPTEQVVRRSEAPSVAETYTAGLERGPLLWTRRPEHWNFLHVRLGLASLPSRSTVAAESASDDGLPEYRRKLEELEERHRLVADVPVVEDLLAAGAIGVVGPSAAAHDVTRGLLVQMVGLHSPAELVLAAVAGAQDTTQHAWMSWLPHTSSPQSPIQGTHLADTVGTATRLVAQLEELVARRRGGVDGVPERRGPLSTDLRATRTGGVIGAEEVPGGRADDLPVVVLLVGAGVPVDRARLVQLSERGPEVGVFLLWVAERTTDLPASCRTHLDVTEGLGAACAHFVRHGRVVQPVAAEGVSVEHAQAFARTMAPVVDSGAVVEDSSDLPSHVSMATLLGEEVLHSSAAVVDRWRQNDSIKQAWVGRGPRRRRPGTLRALVGQAGADAMHLDLRGEGPHALVGGTTGAGKSEFLQAWVLGMAAELSPDLVTFLFVDYKGGSAFAACVNLPHCVGLVTDLDSHLVRRALTSLRAELRHREHLLNRKKAKDLDALERAADPDAPPALVLVIDEFAALANEVPEFVDGVIDIAQRGRSLGIHLIMATQRPAGVIKDNLRANTNLRVALRMADENDSTDVVGTSDAAAIDPAIPGRGLVRTGPGRLLAFQSAYAGGWTAAGGDATDVTVQSLGFGAQAVWELPEEADDAAQSHTGPTDQERMVAVMRRAAEQAAVPEPRRPWLEALSRAYDLALLSPRTDTELVLGVADVPEEQRQETVHFRPDTDGNLAVYGTSGSGKSVLLRTLAASAGVTPRGGPVHVYGLDFAAGGLRMLQVLPHVGAVIGGDDSERVVRLLRMLRELADRRAQEFSAVNAASITEYRQLAGRPDEPRVLLVLDGFPAFRDAWETGAGRAEWYAAFQTLLAEGRQLGIHVAFSADRPASVPGAVAASVPRRVVLRMAEETMYFSLDVPVDVLGSASPPGRALVDGQEMQVAILGGSTNAADQSQALARLADALIRQGVTPALGVGSMPTDVKLLDLPTQVDRWPVLGIADDTLAPLGWSPTGTFVLAGGPQSGRSNALAALAVAARRADDTLSMVYLGQSRSELPSLMDFDRVATSPEEVATLAKELAATLPHTTSDQYLVVVERLSDFASAPTDLALVDLFRAIKRSDHGVLAESETSTWGSSYPLFAELKAGRRGLVLQPDAHDGDTILRTPFPRAARREFPPGRGVAVLNGRIVRVQVPLI